LFIFIFLTSIEYIIFASEMVAKLKTVCEISVNNNASRLTPGGV
jgi:hypothetical protein